MEERIEELFEAADDAAVEKAVEANEDKHEKFYRISQKRIQNAAKQIELIGNCASSDYEYTDEDVDKMFEYLQKALDETKKKYEKNEIPVFSWK